MRESRDSCCLCAHACSFANTRAGFLRFGLARPPSSTQHLLQPLTTTPPRADLSSRLRHSVTAQHNSTMRERRGTRTAPSRGNQDSLQSLVPCNIDQAAGKQHAKRSAPRGSLSGLRRQTRTPRVAAQPGRQMRTACTKRRGVQRGGWRRRAALRCSGQSTSAGQQARASIQNLTLRAPAHKMRSRAQPILCRGNCVPHGSSTRREWSKATILPCE